MGSFYTWMKTSETYRWRYYFLLNDATFSRIMADLQKGGRTELEDLFNMEMSERKQAARVLDNANKITDLIAIVETYKQRAEKFFDGVIKRSTSMNGAPIQVVLLGAADLESSVKKIVRLAI